MFFKNKNYEEELDRLSLEVERAHIRLASLKESHINLEKKIRKLICDQEIENYRKKICYTITENDIVSSYEDPKYLVKHIQACLNSKTPFTLNNMAKNYWLDLLKNNEENELKNNEENKPVEPNYILGGQPKTTTNCYQWR